MIAHATPLRDRVSTEDARAELARSFQLADMAEQSPGMFSTFIDAEWHRLAETADDNDFCKTAVGRVVTHLPINGGGRGHVAGSQPRAVRHAAGNLVRRR